MVGYVILKGEKLYSKRLYLDKEEAERKRSIGQRFLYSKGDYLTVLKVEEVEW